MNDLTNLCPDAETPALSDLHGDVTTRVEPLAADEMEAWYGEYDRGVTSQELEEMYADAYRNDVAYYAGEVRPFSDDSLIGAVEMASDSADPLKLGSSRAAYLDAATAELLRRAAALGAAA